MEESPVAKLVRAREQLERQAEAAANDAALNQIASEGYDLEHPKGYQTTVEFLDELRQQHGLTSDYQVAKALGVSHSRISNWRTKRNTFDDHTAMQIAQLLGYEPGYVLACTAAERTTRRDVRMAWANVAKKLAGVAAALALVQFALWLLGDVSQADHALSAFMLLAGNTHYAHACVIVGSTSRLRQSSAPCPGSHQHLGHILTAALRGHTQGVVAER